MLSKDLLRRYPALTVITWVFAFGALAVLPFSLPALAGLDVGRVRPATWLLVLYIVLVPTVTVYWLNLWPLHRTVSSLVAIYVYLQPAVTVLVAPAVLGERLQLASLVAGAAIFSGIALASLGRRRKREEELPETAL